MLIHPLSLLDSRVLFSMCWERSRLSGTLNVSLSCSVDLGRGRGLPAIGWFCHWVDEVLV